MDDGLRPSFRDASSRPDCGKRVIILGDSIPYGEGVAEHQTYPSILASMLSEADPARQVTVLNAGIRGQTVLQGWARLERHVIRLQPYLVVVAFGLNDAALGKSAVDAWREHVYWRLKRPFPGQMLRWSYILQAVEARARCWQYRRFLRSALPNPQHTRVSAQAYRTSLRAMARRLRSSCEVILATTTPLAPFALGHLSPTMRERQFALYKEYDDIVREVAASEGAELAALSQITQTCDIEELYAQDGIHLTPNGQRAVAQVLFPLIVGMPDSDELKHDRRPVRRPLSI